MTIDMTSERRLAGATAERNGVRIDVDRISRRVRSGRREEVTLLDAVSFSIPAGELVAIVGPSGAGKTTLLEAISGIAPVTAGSVRFDGVDVHANAGAFRSVLGYVPQDDIIHADLALERTLRYAARLRRDRARQDRGRSPGAVDVATPAVGSSRGDVARCQPQMPPPSPAGARPCLVGGPSPVVDARRSEHSKNASRRRDRG